MMDVIDISGKNKIIKIEKKNEVKWTIGPIEVIFDKASKEVNVKYYDHVITRFFLDRKVIKENNDDILHYTTTSPEIKNIHVSWTDKSREYEGWAIKVIFNEATFIVRCKKERDSDTIEVTVHKLIDPLVREDEDPFNEKYFVDKYEITVLSDWEPATPARPVNDEKIQQIMKKCFSEKCSIIGAYKIDPRTYIVDTFNETGQLLIKKQCHEQPVKDEEFSRVLVREVAIPLGKKSFTL